MYFCAYRFGLGWAGVYVNSVLFIVPLKLDLEWAEDRSVDNYLFGNNMSKFSICFCENGKRIIMP